MDSKDDITDRYSSYLQYLPAIYRDDDFVGRFLCIFEDILKPLEDIVDNLVHYFDPGTAPQSFVPWLASWVGLVMDERMPEAKRHELIKSMAELYRWQGTKRGLSEYLRIYTDVTPQIIEHAYSPPAQSGNDAEAGTSQSGMEEGHAFCFSVILNVPDTTAIDADIVRTIIESEKPAHTTYILKISKQKSNI
jgi:phage tail-like protein